MVPGLERGAADHPPSLVLGWCGGVGGVVVGGLWAGDAAVGRESVPLLVCSVVDAHVHLLQLLDGPATRVDSASVGTYQTKRILTPASVKPAEEGFGEVVLGAVLRLDSALQQHLLVELLLLLLLLHVLPHAQTLPVILLDVLCGVRALSKTHKYYH